MGSDHESTVRSRTLGALIHQALKDSQLNATQVAKTVGVAQGTISRMLSGKRGGRARLILDVLDACNLPDWKRAEILRFRSCCMACGCRCLPLPDRCEPSESAFVRQLRARAEERGTRRLGDLWVTRDPDLIHPLVD